MMDEIRREMAAEAALRRARAAAHFKRKAPALAARLRAMARDASAQAAGVEHVRPGTRAGDPGQRVSVETYGEAAARARLGDVFEGSPVALALLVHALERRGFRLKPRGMGRAEVVQ